MWKFESGNCWKKVFSSVLILFVNLLHQKHVVLVHLFIHIERIWRSGRLAIIEDRDPSRIKYRDRLVRSKDKTRSKIERDRFESKVKMGQLDQMLRQSNWAQGRDKHIRWRSRQQLKLIIETSWPKTKFKMGPTKTWPSSNPISRGSTWPWPTLIGVKKSPHDQKVPH